MAWFQSQLPSKVRGPQLRPGTHRPLFQGSQESILESAFTGKGPGARRQSLCFLLYPEKPIKKHPQSCQGCQSAGQQAVCWAQATGPVYGGLLSPSGWPACVCLSSLVPKGDRHVSTAGKDHSHCSFWGTSKNSCQRFPPNGPRSPSIPLPTTLLHLPPDNLGHFSTCE